MKKTLLLVVSLAVVLFVVWLVRSKPPVVNGPQSAGENSSARSADSILDLSFTNYAGQSVALKDWLGTPLVINSWAAWCPFCRQELVDFASIQKEFGEQVVIVAIDRAEPLATAKKYTDDLGVTGDLVLLLDPADSFYQAIGALTMPETVFINRGGQIVFQKRGPMDAEEIRQRVISLW